MSAETTTYSVLSAAAGVTALVGARIYPDMAPADADKPFLVFERAGTTFDYTIHGTVALTQASMQVSCWDDTRSGAAALASAAEAAMVASGYAPSAKDAFFEPTTATYAAVIDFTVEE